MCRLVVVRFRRSPKHAEDARARFHLQGAKQAVSGVASPRSRTVDSLTGILPEGIWEVLAGSEECPMVRPTQGAIEPGMYRKQVLAKRNQATLAK
jgi:hypothetical protein